MSSPGSGGGSAGGSGAAGGTAATNAAEKRAHEARAAALIELEALNMQNREAAILAANAYTTLARETDEAKRAAKELVDAEIDLIRATGQGADKLRALRETSKLLAQDLSELSSIADIMSKKVKGMWGITSTWGTSIPATFAAAVAGGKDFDAELQKMAKSANTTAGKMDSWGSAAMKATELASAGFAGVVHQTFSLAKGLDSVMVSFKSAAGASIAFTQEIPKLESAFYNLGLTSEDAANVMGSLYSSMSGFTLMSPRSQDAIKDTTALLQTMGVDASTSAQNMEILTRSMGYSGSQAAATTRELFALAQQMGVSTNKMMEDFSNLAPQLVVHGSRATTVFKRLQAAAKSTGMEISSMVSIASKFDTFSTAADSVGHLNAVLGGPYLSVMRMIQTTDPTDRMRMLATATREAGLSFESMAYYERKAVQEAMGLSDVNELALIMRGRFDLVGDSVHRNAYEIEKLAEQNKEFKTVEAELQQVLRALAQDMLPLLQSFKVFISKIAEMPAIMGPVIGVILGVKTAVLGLNAAATAAQLGLGRIASGMKVASLAAGPLVAVLGVLAFTMFHEQHSPPIFAENGGMARAAGLTSQFAGSLHGAARGAKLATPEMARFAQSVKAIPGEKVVRLKAVMGEAKNFMAVAQAGSITREHIALMSAATGQAAASPVIQNNIALTSKLDGKVIAHDIMTKINRAT
jgi:hypothetical protein